MTRWVVTDRSETTITVWRPGQRTRWNRLRLWVRQRCDAIGLFRTRRQIRPGDVIEMIGDGDLTETDRGCKIRATTCDVGKRPVRQCATARLSRALVLCDSRHS